MDVKSYVYAKQVFFYLRLWFSCSREKIAPSPRQIHLLRLKKRSASHFPGPSPFFFISLFCQENPFSCHAALYSICLPIHICSYYVLTFAWLFYSNWTNRRKGRDSARALTCLLRWRNQQPTNSNCHCCCAVPFQKIFNAILKFVVCFIFGFWKKIKKNKTKKMKWNFEIFF
jgi:hypothetical protein